MNPRTRVQWRQLFQIIVIWSVIGMLIALYDHLVLQTSGSAGPAADYSLSRSLLVNAAAGLMGALLGGSFLVFFVNERFRDKSYAYTILTVTISFVAVIFIVGQILTLIEPPDMARMMKNGLIWALVVGITQLFLQINSKFGPGVFRDILRGKYNTPREEQRIFMFLDINASTTIAEMLGDKRYHAFLKDFFTDITNPILENRGKFTNTWVMKLSSPGGTATASRKAIVCSVSSTSNTASAPCGKNTWSATVSSRNSKRAYIAGR
ncbi:hypothetical protein WJU16_01535 [Chitinophaga pollutisoli]|uniref:Guanylate cyclase domain-containing protein n=1 Tax=Chitinophaga pollutisoli TaxID=3133966 RepID=A0ABZ2YSA4_9BACT